MNNSSSTIAPNTTTTTPYAPILPSNDKCNYYIVNQTSIAWLDFGNPYGGIPQNLLINSVSNFISHYIGHISHICIDASTIFDFRLGLWCCCFCLPYSGGLRGTMGDSPSSGRMTTSQAGLRYFTLKDSRTRTGRRRRKMQHLKARTLSSRTVLVLIINHFQEDLLATWRMTRTL